MFKNQQVVLKVTGIDKSFVDRKLLENIQFEIKTGDRIGLVGLNGTGKTTLVNIIFGKISPDKGTIDIAENCRIGYLTQSIDYQFNDFQESIEEENKLLQHASELGLKKVYEWQDERLSQLSGGEKLKLALSMVWASNPDFLILDEPTNHLDYKGIEWLITELARFPGPVLVISHDRHFLDQTIGQIFELENKQLHFYKGNYSDYRKEKQQRIDSQKHQYNVQQRYKENIEKQMEQLKNWADKAHRDSTKQGGSVSEKRQMGLKEFHRVKAKKLDGQVKSKLKRLQSELEKNKVERPNEEAKVRFQFDSQGKRGKRILEANRLSKNFEGRVLFQGANFYINHGERIGLLGDNGCGKTTLIKMILGEEPESDGQLWISQTVKIAYLSQDVNDLPEHKNAIEALGLTNRKDIYHARTILANLGLKEEMITKPVSTLSLGERTRIKLADMLMKKYDVLILDEPTNHLDLPSREQLEKTLSEFTGTIINVSHDYYFLNMLCDKLLVFENQVIKRVEMRPEEFLKPKKSNPEEEIMVIENQLASVLGELSLIDQKSPKYAQLDHEFNQLMQKKKKLTRNK